ncbi:MAG: peptidoglycan recognition family protein [Planctomycetota bacterium]|nr:peptidoglycan recognition family protein [Planctomycetota bacterium]
MKSSIGSRSKQVAACVFVRSSLTLTGLALAFAACRSPHVPSSPPEPVAVATYEPDPVDVAPSWLAEPLSWEKLKRVEAWIASEGQRSAPLWKNEAALVVNLGRLEFVRREAGDSAKKRDADVDRRIKTARSGLESVASNAEATDAQRRRAQDGVRRADRLLGNTSFVTKVSAPMGVPVIARSAWGAARPHTERMDKTAGEYTRITVHHSADPTPIELDGTSSKSFEAVREIQKAHMDGKSTHYGDIGYHFVIDPYGRLMEGRDLRYQGAHAYGDNNLQNIGICLIGNFEKETPTKAALDALEREIEGLRKQYDIPKKRVYGHRELRSTECPGDKLMRWIERYRKS